MATIAFFSQPANMEKQSSINREFDIQSESAQPTASATAESVDESTTTSELPRTRRHTTSPAAAQPFISSIDFTSSSTEIAQPISTLFATENSQPSTWIANADIGILSTTALSLETSTVTPHSSASINDMGTIHVVIYFCVAILAILLLMCGYLGYASRKQSRNFHDFGAPTGKLSPVPGDSKATTSNGEIERQGSKKSASSESRLSVISESDEDSSLTWDMSTAVAGGACAADATHTVEPESPHTVIEMSFEPIPLDLDEPEPTLPRACEMTLPRPSAPLPGSTVDRDIRAKSVTVMTEDDLTSMTPTSITDHKTQDAESPASSKPPARSQTVTATAAVIGKQQHSKPFYSWAFAKGPNPRRGSASSILGALNWIPVDSAKETASIDNFASANASGTLSRQGTLRRRASSITGTRPHPIDTTMERRGSASSYSRIPRQGSLQRRGSSALEMKMPNGFDHDQLIKMYMEDPELFSTLHRSMQRKKIAARASTDGGDFE
ncbi:hypothetical protein BJ742DRAFT_781892 [Cladochytrium replicatum]|nr:hypothetical protein BJ742DRAFT_781892 [Cladochytrium replicatum]